MMTSLSSKVLQCLTGKTLVTAESLTGGGIGAALTAIPGSSLVYKGGIICYTDWVKQHMLDVSQGDLQTFGAVSAPVAEAMARHIRTRMQADVAVSVTGLAGPGGDAFGHEVGTVFIGYADASRCVVRECHFSGDREDVRLQTIQTAMRLILSMAEGIPADEEKS